MKIYTISSGITCIEPEEGYLLKRNGQTYKNIMLGKYNKPEYYEEVRDPDYIMSEPEESQPEQGQQHESLYVLTSPNGKRFKLTVSDDGDLQLIEI